MRTELKLTEHANDEDEVLKNLHDATVAEKIAQQVCTSVLLFSCNVADTRHWQTLVEIGFGEKQRNNRQKRKET